MQPCARITVLPALAGQKANCVTCGGFFCNGRGDGDGTCCNGVIENLGVYCDETLEAPCILRYLESESSSTTEELVALRKPNVNPRFAGCATYWLLNTCALLLGLN